MSSQHPPTTALALALLQLNVEGLTIAKINILEQVASTNNVTVTLQETHQKNKNILRVPGYTLAGHTANKQHGIATFVRKDMTWSAAGQSPEGAEIEWIATKLLERLILVRLTPVINPQPKEQAGFRSDRSTTDQVTLLCHDIEESFQAGEKAGAVLLDLTAAYDTVWLHGLHMKLLETIPDKHMVSFIMNMLSNRSFRIHTSNSQSSRGCLAGTTRGATTKTLWIFTEALVFSAAVPQSGAAALMFKSCMLPSTLPYELSPDAYEPLQLTNCLSMP
ncbi:hypothetical protein D5F01_LYC11232 [Larimichthys crocea]|uniref:Reverse transcriptase domain-containing protein n=1 Tax=Larimichthys crocea TaxID=215358 RepID=A0A6G0IDL9_LARCR|nr:hypothetical protein D5F01_LYC11232 [Larimichthys crocea]